MFVAKICVCLVSSTTVMTETRDESLSSATKSLVIGASARRNACGPRINLSDLLLGEAENSRRLELARAVPLRARRDRSRSRTRA